jgi:hypothetical protein
LLNLGSRGRAVESRCAFVQRPSVVLGFVESIVDNGLAVLEERCFVILMPVVCGCSMSPGGDVESGEIGVVAQARDFVDGNPERDCQVGNTGWLGSQSVRCSKYAGKREGRKGSLELHLERGGSGGLKGRR